jgi:hypothetical protein
VRCAARRCCSCAARADASVLLSRCEPAWARLAVLAAACPPPPSASAMPSAVSPLEALPTLVPHHFQDAQHSLATHRKNVVALQRAHAAAAQVTQRTERGTKLVGEKAFNEVFIACLNRVLGIKKGVVNADRIVKFVAAYASCEWRCGPGLVRRDWAGSGVVRSSSASAPVVGHRLTDASQMLRAPSVPPRARRPARSRRRTTRRRTRRRRASSPSCSSTCCAALAPRTRRCACAAARPWRC